MGRRYIQRFVKGRVFKNTPQSEQGRRNPNRSLGRCIGISRGDPVIVVKVIRKLYVYIVLLTTTASVKMELNTVGRLKQSHNLIPYEEKLKIKAAGRPMPMIEFDGKRQCRLVPTKTTSCPYQIVILWRLNCCT